MTKKEIIEDGWIEKYVLGLTSEQESGEVERMASLYPDIQDQINSARSRLCGKFNRNLTQPALRHSLLTKRRVLFGSAIVVSLLLLGFTILFWEHFSLKEDYYSQYEKLAREQVKVDQMTSQSRMATERSSFINASTTRRIKVKGCDSAPDAEVLAFQCMLTGKMKMQIVELPELPDGHYYEVWANYADQTNRMIGQLTPPFRYDSLYVLDTMLHSMALEIKAMDPVHNRSEPVCLAILKK